MNTLGNPIDALNKLKAAARTTVADLRGGLPAHPTKRYRRVPLAERRGICFHHAGAWGTVTGAARYHVEDKDWPGLAYTLAVERDGSLIVAHDLDVVTYSQGDADSPGDENVFYFGILVNGFFASRDFPYSAGSGEPTVEQLATVLRLIQWARGCGLHEIKGHFDYGKPSCPGATIEAIIRGARHDKAVTAVAEFDFDLSTVRGYQSALRALGYDPGEPDGVVGWRTRGAVISFQRSAGLAADGIYGPLTRAAIERALRLKKKT